MKTICAVIRDYYYSSTSSYVRLMRVVAHCECDPQRYFAKKIIRSCKRRKAFIVVHENALILGKIRTHLKTICAVIRDYYYSSTSSYVRLKRVVARCECDSQLYIAKKFINSCKRKKTFISFEELIFSRGALGALSVLTLLIPFALRCDNCLARITGRERDRTRTA